MSRIGRSAQLLNSQYVHAKYSFILLNRYNVPNNYIISNCFDLFIITILSGKMFFVNFILKSKTN